MLTMLRTIAILATVSSTPVFAADDFASIHGDNQKIGSAVSEFWAGLADNAAPLPQDGFMAIHMANQMEGSAVANFWDLLSTTCPVLTAEASR